MGSAGIPAPLLLLEAYDYIHQELELVDQHGQSPAQVSQPSFLSLLFWKPHHYIGVYHEQAYHIAVR